MLIKEQNGGYWISAQTPEEEKQLVNLIAALNQQPMSAGDVAVPPGTPEPKPHIIRAV